MLRRGTGLPPLSPHPFSRIGRPASLRSDGLEDEYCLTKSITSPENQTSQRRFAPMVIAEGEIVDRFQLETVIVFMKIRNKCQRRD